MLAEQQDGTVTLQLKVLFLPGPLNKLRPSPALQLSANLRHTQLSLSLWPGPVLSHRLCLGGGETSVPGAQEGVKTEGLFPPGCQQGDPGGPVVCRACQCAAAKSECG